MFYIGFLFKKMSDLLIPSFLVSDVSESLRSLIKNERCERIPQVTHQKWATMSDLLRLLTKMSDHERIAQGAHQKWANERIARFLSKLLFCSSFRKKMSDSLRKPKSKFPALHRRGGEWSVWRKKAREGWDKEYREVCEPIRRRKMDGERTVGQCMRVVYCSVFTME